MHRSVLILATVALACSKSGGGASTPAPSGDAGATGPAMTGAIQLTIAVAVPEGARAELKQHTAELQAMGRTLSDDGTMLRATPKPAGGWMVQLGSRRVPTDGMGRFTLPVPAGGPKQGQIFYPSDLQNPLTTFDVADLVPEGGTPKPIAFELRLPGACGMNPPEAGMPMGCAGTGQPLVLANTPNPTEPNPQGAPKTMKDLGTYPVGNQNRCADYYGASDIDHPPMSLPDGTFSVLWGYVNSICSNKVDEGCCGDEVGSFVVSAKVALNDAGLINFKPKDCYVNHKGRQCQETTKGDVAVQTEQGTVRGSPLLPARQEIAIQLGYKSHPAVHNNGCYGETFVFSLDTSFGGMLSGVAGNLKGDVLMHYNGGPKNFVYGADQPIEYQAPRCLGAITGKEQDIYWLGADGYYVQLTYKPKTTNLWQFAGGGMIFSGDNQSSDPIDGWHIANPDTYCDGKHVHGKHPCTGAADPAPQGCGHGKVVPVDVPK